jgi:thiol-disulfide isomerase/thioredoxin
MTRKVAPLLTVIALVAGCSSAPKATPAAAVAAHPDRKIAANFSLTDANGAPVTLAGLKGKVVLLNFWATWCGPCKVEIPWFTQFNKTYKDKGLAVVGVAMDDDGWKSVKPYLTEKKMDYTIVVGNDQVGQSYGGIDSLPTTFLIDRDGRIAFTHTGLVAKDTYEKEIQSLLSGDQIASVADAFKK